MSRRKLPVFNPDAVAAQMIEAARKALTERSSSMNSVGETEIRRLAGALADIGTHAAKGDIDEEKARHFLTLHQLSVRTFLRSAEGLTILAADQALGAAMRVGVAVLQQVTGFRLLPTTEAPETSTASFKAGKDL